MAVSINDPRLFAPQCHSLQPVEVAHSNPWFTVRNRGGYYTIEESTPQVVILPIVDDRAVIMVREERPVIADVTLELPAGGARPGEQPAQAAARELAEETGVEVGSLSRFEPLPPIVVHPRCPFLPFLFQVTLSTEEYHARKPPDGEITEVLLLSFDEVAAMISASEIYIGLQMGILARFLIGRQLNGKTIHWSNP